MNVNSLTGYSGILRLSGLASGLDTDSMVQEMMRAERIPLDKLYQRRQAAEWKTDAYRFITNLLREFKDNYFNYAKPATNMLSSTTYKTFVAAVTEAATGSTSTAVTVGGSVDAMAGEHTVEVLQLATAATRVSAQGVTRTLAGAEAAEFAAVAGKSFTVNLDGVQKTITFAADGSDGNLAGLNGLLEEAFGPGRVTVTETSPGSGVLRFSAGGGATRITLTAAAADNALEYLRFTSGDTNRLNLGMTLQDVSAHLVAPLVLNDGNVEFTINGKSFIFSQYETLGSILNTINGDATAQVNLSYDELTDRFTLVSDVYGSAANINVAETGNFCAALGLTPATETAGRDAQIKFDGTLVTRSSNTITVNGINLTLNRVTEDPLQIKMTLDTDKVYDQIKNFVDKYNEVITEINGKLSEPRERDYLPLTDEQREAMTEDQIEKWEEKAKSGLLRNDSLLQNIVYGLRRAITDPIAGAAGNLAELGITTGSYTEKGRLTIDEAKLREAIRNNPDKVMEVFARQSDISYYAADKPEMRAERYNNEGVAQRFFDVLEDNIKTYGGKGLLLEKAGIAGDASEFDNTLRDDIGRIDEQIEKLVDKLARKENEYYRRFTVLEQYMQQMNAQAAWLAQQFGGGV
ncbi:MAG: flagellar filament capping protein FliD [bacterium]|jgi:flagellar hook-associated protein 2